MFNYGVWLILAQVQSVLSQRTAIVSGARLMQKLTVQLRKVSANVISMYDAAQLAELALDMDRLLAAAGIEVSTVPMPLCPC